MTVNFENSPVYVNANVVHLVSKLVDLFCIGVDFDFKISPRRSNAAGNSTIPSKEKGPQSTKTPRAIVGCSQRGKVRGTTVVHELLHMAGYEHTRGINETHNYTALHYVCFSSGFRNQDQVDTYSRLVLKDLTGKYEVFL
jgi:hypothetical protein